jgi:hypothetical protein
MVVVIIHNAVVNKQRCEDTSVNIQIARNVVLLGYPNYITTEYGTAGVVEFNVQSMDQQNRLPAALSHIYPQ